MLWIIQTIVVSILLIFLVHHLILFFKSMLTVPKIKDLVNNPKQKYEEIYNTIQNYDNLNNKTNLNTNEYTMIDLLPKKETNDDMKNELKDFLKKQLHNTQDTINNYK
jgi:hypothetical protein